MADVIVVTGGAGFIGSNVVCRLAQRGAHVRVIDDLSAGSTDYLKGCGAELVKGDIADAALVRSALDGATHVVHLAASTAVVESVANPMPGLFTNVVALVGFLRAASDAGVQKFVFASSNAVIGQSEPPIDERHLPRPSSPYGASKLAGEAYCWAFHESYELPVVILRFANVYGPNSLHKGNALHKFVRAALTDQPITVFGDGEQTRDFIYVRDVADAIDRALKAPVAGELFQIGTGIETSIRMLLERLEAVSGRPLRITHAPPNKGEIRRSACDIRKARTELGFEPSVSLDDGLAMTFRWFKERFDSGTMTGVVARAGD